MFTSGRSDIKSSRKALALLGGVSRPSRNKCKTSRALAPCKVFTRLTIWFWWEWTPPGPRSPAIWIFPSLEVTLSISLASVLLAASDPSAMAASMRGKSCITIRPAPRFMCPTSELPICPFGSPTWRSDAFNWLCGAVEVNRSQTGVFASAIALLSRSSRSPHPSNTQRTTGRIRELIAIMGTRQVKFKNLCRDY